MFKRSDQMVIIEPSYVESIEFIIAASRSACQDAPGEIFILLAIDAIDGQVQIVVFSYVLNRPELLVHSA
ncbi:hypothetical protein J6590_010045 [Homalodisca vitripennis]|nr:hypothetical protein J6590_010045 [Homalodisca vitripennis]